MILCSCAVSAQVNEIKSASKGGGRGGEGGGGGGGTDVGLAIDIVYFTFQGVGAWQRHTLEKRESIPSLVSFEGSFQTAIQPSTYYIVHPRFRGNWGLFSTDVRVNYLIEETQEGAIHLRTTDWQVLQLNVITTPRVNFRVGGGVIYESYGDKKTHGEMTLAFDLRPGLKRIGMNLEYRTAEARNEVNGGLLYDLGSSGKFHWFATLGGAFQRYYSAINVWGIQGGVGFRLY
jgi:hypothetical protein